MDNAGRRGDDDRPASHLLTNLTTRARAGESPVRKVTVTSAPEDRPVPSHLSTWHSRHPTLLPSLPAHSSILVPTDRAGQRER